jgi:hypothetical protein
VDEKGNIRQITPEEPLRPGEIELTRAEAERMLRLDFQDRVKEYENITGKAAKKAAKRQRARARKAKKR